VAGLAERFPRTRRLIGRLSGHQILFSASGLAFYALISLAPVVILVMWIASLLLGDQRVHHFADAVGRMAPNDLGLDSALRSVAQRGTSIGVLAGVTALWPASAYGAGLTRAFDRVADGSYELPGLRGRVLLIVVLLPLSTVGALVVSYLGTTLVDPSLFHGVAAGLVALGVGFVWIFVSTLLIYRVFPPERLPWNAILRATLIAAGGAAALSALLALFLAAGANFKEHYATSAVASLVLIGIWLYLSNALLLAGFRLVDTD
jgi:YihY family inner membrane protein